MEKLEGMISEIVFKNEDNGYTIAHLVNENDEIVVVGCMPTLAMGESIEVEGKWVNHKIYGTQFEVNSFMPVTPSSLEGIYVYLSSGMIHGIGEKMAKRIIDKFGVDTLDIIQNYPEKLQEVEGIGSKKVKQIVKSYEEDRELRNIIIELSPFGITPNYCLKIYKKYKSSAIEIINKNPYQLAEDIRGIGFKVADSIANKIGIDKNSKDRICQGILYTLNKSLSNGHTYLPEHILIQDSEKLLELSGDIVKECVMMLVYNQKIHIEKVNNENLIYLMPYYLSENGVCSQIVKLSQYEFEDLNIDIENEIKILEDDKNIKLAEKQVLAVKESVNSGVLIITGGPGTGKTTTINAIIDIFENNGKSVTLAAPTGRAAKRMSETSNKEAKTIHRLLEMGFSTDDDLTFFKDEEDPINSDVIIVDEVSMVDIILMYNLLRAIKLGTRVILVGDSDQLPSVGAGNVLKDMIDSNIINVVKLNEIFRQAQQSMIIVNAHKINNGEPLHLNTKGKDFFFIRKSTNEEILNEIIGLVNERLPKFYNVDKLKDIQVLSSMRKGELGVTNLNIELQKYLNKKEKFKVEESFSKRLFRVGDKVMQVKNNYTKKWETEDQKESGEGIYNGDIGYVYHIDKDKKTIYVLFDQTKIVSYLYDELDEIDHSFCTTIHKSQGSEFPVVVIPITWAPPMLLSRNLLYTAVTRAKKLVVLVGDVKYLEYMIKNNRVNQRYSNLGYKLNKFKQEGLLIE
ncbi:MULTISPECIES: ATP-dependent RecD-like DNA helicase [unclassified Clostridioides]|uniref:SF1B family DNA helicase RecD2 n=1 Tax=unclassified Clostridioides TaxID=2635829 RepID=UPI001D0C6E69|nr:ATP-dependent RecD-like DNA helicase [Clostridioides sp. ES-S-0001-02]MCC0654324.1 ATP-dependent RecD-like DNA helicase [Clostridioides sp. ES-S-0001-03]MCC0674109.1 ATP-dependent RecD-like DNA helicase [Clostridioides sp. ES-S-0145-01]MCC0681784.1 ATP-dependent RecD-like DNA helicase [Clostridioides sp. ES-S-0005-03]MCC0703677.1 ATP-dependent RecD-like DNA helicase [Clostridioides sp. ES-S-0049-02]MCC0708899.1 ATP-dependent RecD-like DNA helicase [Clostridioides sp. ES-S-0190-01]MCC076350